MASSIAEIEERKDTRRPVDRQRVEYLYSELLLALGVDRESEGLRDTPRRAAAAWCEFLDYADDNISTLFEQPGTNQMVTLGPVRVWSKCEHHLESFYCDVWMGYIAVGAVIGISKLARIAELYAHRLQNQERLVEEIAQEICQQAKTEDVVVVARGVHLCLCARGIGKDAPMGSSALRGRFKHDAAMRAEFYTLTQIGKT